MKLTRQERRALVRARDDEGSWPKITRDPKHGRPCEEGDRIEVSSIMWLQVTAVRRSRHGDWVVVYEPRSIERDRYLAPAGHAIPLDDSGEAKAMTHDESLGYTGNPRGALDKDAPAVSDADQELITERAKHRADEEQRREQARREKQTLETRLGIACKVAAIKGIDITTHELAIKRRIRDIEQLLDKAPQQRAA